ncbi:MAG: hypothetical protein JRK53_25375 [Deltaproteobacteria bacterium]|nr:hypothetical protein [Deltaproteobacteria bacterium]
MKCLIIAAGKGSRLRQWGDSKPLIKAVITGGYSLNERFYNSMDCVLTFNAIHHFDFEGQIKPVTASSKVPDIISFTHCKCTSDVFSVPQASSRNRLRGFSCPGLRKTLDPFFDKVLSFLV